MTTKEILNLDYRKGESQEIIQKVLRQIKPLSKYSDEYDVPLSAIEKAISVMCKKYPVQINGIYPDCFGNERSIIWRMVLANSKNFKQIDCIYGISLYELFAKAAIRLYAEVKKGTSKR